MNKVFAFATFILLLAGCTPEPSACILTDDDNFILAGNAVQFYNCSFDASSYLWDFGDGTTSTDKEPIHSYNNSGTYKVELFAKSKNGKKQNMVVKTVHVINSGIDMFIGFYDVNSNCSSGNFNNGISITPANGDTVNIFGIIGSGVNNTLAIIIGDSIVIHSQSLIFSGTTISGTGIMNNGMLTINYSETDGLTTDVCTLTGFKQ